MKILEICDKIEEGYCRLPSATLCCKEGGLMSTAMEIIERANREKKGIAIIISGSPEMGTRIPICVKMKNQETSHHNEEITLEVDLSNYMNKVAYVCDEKRTKVKVSQFMYTDSVRRDAPAYAFLSAHVFVSYDEVAVQKMEEVPLIPELKDYHYVSEW